MYFVYLLECKDGSLYTGITTDLKRRLAEHRSKEGGRYTRAKGAKGIVYFEKKANRSTALKREAEIKKLSRQEKLELVLSSKYMEDKEAIDILKRMLEKYPLEKNEREAVLTAIGILGWSKLMEGRVKSITKARAKRFGSEE